LIGHEVDNEYTIYHFDYRGSTVVLTDSSKTPFLFNGMYGVMTDSNGLYYMRARFYSPEIKRFVNQDILLGGIGEGQTLNRYAFVTGQPVSLVDPFGLFGMDDTASMALDFIPVVSSCKGVIEFIIGIDPLTGEPIPRWIAAIGIIPGGKYFTKGGKVGEAIIHIYKIHGNEHVSILVKSNDEIVHTHQVITSASNLDTTIKIVNENMMKFQTGSINVILPNAKAAQKRQNELIDKELGKYDIDINSCLSHACDVLKSGGMDVPTKGNKAMQDFFKNTK